MGDLQPVLPLQGSREVGVGASPTHDWFLRLLNCFQGETWMWKTDKLLGKIEVGPTHGWR